jgi:hypothetical protein
MMTPDESQRQSTASVDPDRAPEPEVEALETDDE